MKSGIPKSAMQNGNSLAACAYLPGTRVGTNAGYWSGKSSGEYATKTMTLYCMSSGAIEPNSSGATGTSRSAAMERSKASKSTEIFEARCVVTPGLKP